MAKSKPSKAPPRRLIIAEKPLQGKSLADALLVPDSREEGQGYVTGKTSDGMLACVTWAQGHLLEIAPPDAHNPKWKHWNLDDLPIIPKDMLFRYTPKNWDALSRIQDLLERATEVVNACDAGREGELIFAEILTHLGLGEEMDGGGGRDLLVSRMWLKATTKSAIIQAWEARRPAHHRHYSSLREAGYARAHGDWIWGINLSRLASLALPKFEDRTHQSIGRVQTPLLFVIYDRCREVREFKPDDFWILEGVFRGEGGSDFKAHVIAPKEMRHGSVDHHFRQISGSMDMKRECLVHATMPWSVHDEVKVSTQNSHPPFNLLELQRAASRIYRWSPAKTLALAQSLYEKDHAISYPRTDSEAFPEEMKEEVLEIRNRLWSEWAVKQYPRLKALPPPPEPTDQHFDNKKVSDHYALMPTGIYPAYEDPAHPGDLREEYQLWTLITTRFLLAWLPPAKMSAARRIMLRPFRDDNLLRAVLECEPVEDPGWLLYEDKMMNCSGIGKSLNERMAEKMFPPCPTGEAKVAFIRVIPRQTSPPHYHNDDTLLGAMNRMGLGTSATRAETIQKIQDDGYVRREPLGSYRSTADGNKLIELLKAAGADPFYDPKNTEYWETLLGRMEMRIPNRPTRVMFLQNICAKVSEMVSLLCARPATNELDFDPDTGAKIERGEAGYIYPKGSRMHGVRCPLLFAGREMAATDYNAILVGGKKGGGPFKFLSKRTGKHYDAFLMLKVKDKRLEFLFKTRGNRGAT